MIDTEIIEDYSNEARELLDEMENSLIRLEKEGATADLLNNIFRAVHCIKGSAEYIGLERSSTLTHGVENLLDHLREDRLELTPEMTEFLFRAKDSIHALIREVAADHEEKTDVGELMAELNGFMSGQPVAGASSREDMPAGDGSPPRMAESLGEDMDAADQPSGLETGLDTVEIIPSGPEALDEPPSVDSAEIDGTLDDDEEDGFEEEITTEEVQEVLDRMRDDVVIEEGDRGEIVDFAGEPGVDEVASETDTPGDAPADEGEELGTIDAARFALGGTMEDEAEQVEQQLSSASGEPGSGDDAHLDDVDDFSEDDLHVYSDTELISGPPDPRVPSTQTRTASPEAAEDEELPAGHTLEESIPHVLNLSLYLDDLEDGLDVRDILPQLLTNARQLKKTYAFLDMKDAMDDIAAMIARCEELSEAEGRLPREDALYLRGVLYRLQSSYPSEHFPGPEHSVEPDTEWATPMEPTAEWSGAPLEPTGEWSTPDETSPELSTPSEPEPVGAEASAFQRQLQKIPGVDHTLAQAVEAAGFSSAEDLAYGDLEVLLEIPGMTKEVARRLLGQQSVEKATQPPGARTGRARQRSLLADVDDELLNEFEGIFGSGRPSGLEEALGGASGEVEGAVEGAETSEAAELLAELDVIGEETDREIVEIFMSYGREIMDKMAPVIAKVSSGAAESGDLDACAEAIKSIRSSSAYMDYQRLANFLDEWYERTLWASGKQDSIGPAELAFMPRNFRTLQQFLAGLQRVLTSDTAAAATTEHVEQPPPARAERVQAPAPKPPSRVAPPDRHAPPPPQPAAGASAGGYVSQSGASVASSGEPHVTRSRTVSAQPAAQPNQADGVAPTRPQPASRREEEHRPRATRPQESPSPEKQPRRQARPAAAEPPPLAPPPEQDFREEADAGAPGADTAAAPRDVSPEAPVVRTMRVDAAKVDTLLNRVGELVVNRSYVEQISLEIRSFQRDLMAADEIGKKEVQTVKTLALKVAEASLSLGRVATDLQEGVMKLRMLPVGQLFNRMPRLIRDLGRRVGKSVNLQVQGAETEVDKRVIEQIYNPLVHLIRNAVDHGIEEREIRRQHNKPAEGTIRLNAYSQGNLVVIDVEDDGRGIDTDAVLRKAVENRLVDAADAKNVAPEEAYNFLFVPGFSTSKKVTRTSGRGVGMDVVKKDVEKINGSVEIDSSPGEGTRISIKIPLTLAIIQTLLIKEAKHVFAVPLTQVREIIQVSLREIRTIEGFEVIKFRQETIPILRTREVFNLSNGDDGGESRYVVLATAGTKTVGFLVQELVGEQDVVIKPLAEHVFKSRGLAGSTILGDGTIALVLDVGELVEDVIARERQLMLDGWRLEEQSRA